jgi:hypothetical protein
MTIDQTQRPRFFEGQYLGSDDLTDALDYARLQAARHALGGHTWGIAAGLDLREVPSIGDATKVSMVIDPGYAWDGFGRPIVVLEPYKIPEALFDSIKYDAVQDADGKGRRTEIWLRYSEAGMKRPAAGFEVCDTANTYRRIQESFLVSIGCKLAHTDDHDPVTVGGKSGDALKALKFFNSKAPTIYDESIPQQTFPEEGERAYWFVPIGYVRWLPAQSGAGHFVALSGTDKDKVRLFRRYIGTVAESIEAAGGAIRLRDRTVNPSTSYFKVTDDELVNIEGSERVEGDVNLAGGALNFRHADGTDRDTALRILRTGDSSSSEGGRSLQVGIGPDDQTDNKFSIGPMEIDTSKDPEEYTVDPKVTVVSDGNVGIGTDSPEVRLHAVGDRIRLESEDGTQRIDLRTDEDRVDVESTTSKLYLHSSGDETKSLNQVIINPFNDDGEGEVGIGTESPTEKLHVVGDRIRLENSDASKRIDLCTDETAVDVRSDTSDLYLRGKSRVLINPISGDGNVGVGTETPTQKLHVVGSRIRLATSTGSKQLDLRIDGSAVDLQSQKNKLYLRSSGGIGNNHIIMNHHSTEDGNIGIGLEEPVCKLHVAKDIAGAETTVANHVAVVENTSASSGGDVLALKIKDTSPDTSNNFITFFQNTTVIGRIEAFSVFGTVGVYLTSGSGDYAESLPRLDEKENLEAGDVIGSLDGKVTRRTAGAHHVSAITDRPIVLANAPRPDDPRKFEKVSFLGQVYVKVRGPVRAGEYIVPSGASDGFGLALPAEKINPQQAGQILGQAWESSTEEGAKRVLVAVGLPSSHSAPLAAVIQNLGRQIEALKEEVNHLKKP